MISKCVRLYVEDYIYNHVNYLHQILFSIHIQKTIEMTDGKKYGNFCFHLSLSSLPFLILQS